MIFGSERPFEALGSLSNIEVSWVWNGDSESGKDRNDAQFDFFKWANPGVFFIYFRLFKYTTYFTTNAYVKNVHPVYGAGIWTHKLWNMSLLP